MPKTNSVAIKDPNRIGIINHELSETRIDTGTRNKIALCILVAPKLKTLETTPFRE
jgi:hypothetical protein